MYRLMMVFAACTALVVVSQRLEAAGRCHGLLKAKCPRCKSCCNLKVDCVNEEKECFEIECEQICVPRVVFPWQKRRAQRNGSACGSCTSSCDACAKSRDSSGNGCGACSCVNNGARVKTVKKLKKKSYKCPTCEYEWELACGAGCGEGCCADDCCDSGCDATPVGAGEPAAAGQGFHAPVPQVGTATLLPHKHRTRAQPVARRTLSDK
jgi:hypothetical protein